MHGLQVEINENQDFGVRNETIIVLFLLRA